MLTIIIIILRNNKILPLRNNAVIDILIMPNDSNLKKYISMSYVGNYVFVSFNSRQFK